MGLIWFVPSFYGDIKLEPRDNGRLTRVLLSKLSPSETEAMRVMLATAIKKGWWVTQSIESDLKAEALDLIAPIDKIAASIAKTLKSGRTTLTAVKFSDGKIEEFHGGILAASDESKPVKSPKPEPIAAATVAEPAKGCPSPVFEAAELAANRVLEVFLDAEQREDFREQNAFVSIGADTGHRYMVTSRQNRRLMDRYGRSLYDLEERRTYCVHDWDVPAAEEMLGIHLCLSLPGREAYLRKLLPLGH